MGGGLERKRWSGRKGEGGGGGEKGESRRWGGGEEVEVNKNLQV